jgi:hypothetical protein
VIQLPDLSWYAAGAVSVLCLLGFIGVATTAKHLWTEPRDFICSKWRTFALIGGGSLLVLVSGVLAGFIQIARKYPDRLERASKRRQFLFSATCLSITYIAEEWSRLSVLAPAWLFPLCGMLAALSILHFVRTVRSVLFGDHPENTLCDPRF